MLKRLLVNLRKAHPHLKFLITLDGLYADSVIIRLLKELDMRYLITANEKDLKFLHEFYHSTQKETFLLMKEKSELSFNWANTLPINAAHADEFVNMLVVNEVIHQKKKTIYQKFSWITDIIIQASIAEQLMRGGRARW